MNDEVISMEKETSTTSRRSSGESLETQVDQKESIVDKTKTKSKKVIKKESQDSVSPKQVVELQPKDESEVKSPEIDKVCKTTVSRYLKR